MYVGGEAEVGGAAGGMQAGAWRDVEERERQELTQTGVHEQGSCDPRGRFETWKGSALVFASRMGKTGMVEKLLAAGAKAESTDEVKEREPCTQSRWRHWCACCQHP